MSDLEALGRLLDDRWSCRGFLDRQVPRDTIERLLTVAQRTPSWCNTQPWHLSITSGEATVKLREALLSQQRRRETGRQLYEAVGIKRGDREASTAQAVKNFEFFGAPHVAILTTEEDLGVYGAIDCGLYVDSFLLAAQALGLGAIAQAALAARAPFLRERFGLPESRKVVCGISFGYADPDHPTGTYRTSRADIDTAATFVD